MYQNPPRYHGQWSDGWRWEDDAGVWHFVKGIYVMTYDNRELIIHPDDEGKAFVIFECRPEKDHGMCCWLEKRPFAQGVYDRLGAFWKFMQEFIPDYQRKEFDPDMYLSWSMYSWGWIKDRPVQMM
jgi:hypothetical protein